MEAKTKNIFLSTVALLLFFLPFHAVARTPEQGEFKAAMQIAVDIAQWIDSLKPRPKTLGIFGVRSNSPLDQDFSNLLETEVLKNLAKHGFQGVISCSECRAPQVTVDEDKLVVTKGPFGAEAVRKLGKTQPVEQLVVIDVFRGQFNVLAHVAIYENPSGTVLNSEKFSASALNVTDVSVQFLLNFGLGSVIVGKDVTPAVFALMGGMSLLEEIGFAKGGVNIGMILAGAHGTMFYVDPTLAFRGHFGSSALAWSWHFGVGYGFNSDGKGLVFRNSFELYLSPLAEIGVEGIYMIPDVTIPTLQSVVGLHVGISFGR